MAEALTIQEAFNRAVDHHEAGRLADAEPIYRQILERDPAHHPALHAFALLAFQVGRSDVAADLASRAIQIHSASAMYFNTLGNALSTLGHLPEAIDALTTATRLAPDDHAFHNNLANALSVAGLLDQAVAEYQKVIELEPNLPEPYNNLANALRAQRRYDAAAEAFEKAIALNPNLAEPHNNLATVYTVQGRIDDAIAAVRKAIQLKPTYINAHSNLLMILQYSPKVDSQQLFDEHLEWARIHAEPITRSVAHVHDNDPNLNRRLRIGYVSPDFHSHVVSYFIEPILKHHDHANFEIFCYADVARPDKHTDRFTTYADHWRPIAGLSDDRVAQIIKDDRIDILVDLASHTGKRLQLLARKAAPIQATYIGYPSGTGLSAIDYWITDAVTDPPGDERFYAEKLIRLPNGFSTYIPPIYAPPVEPAPCVASGTITFGSLHGAAKLNVDVVTLWARILLAIPGSRLILFRDALFGSAGARLRAEFNSLGVPDDRLDIRHLPPPGGYLHTYKEIDIALDPFPWSGHTTACEALWMGVPIVTLRGHRRSGRLAASVLTQLQLTDLIAETPDDYLAITTKLATDRDRLIDLRTTLRDRFRSSPAGNGPSFTLDLENAYREMWHRHVTVA